MALETGERIYSNDYFDLIIRFYTEISNLEKLPNSTYEIVGPAIGVVRVPVEQITNDTMSQLGYLVIPSLSGLISQTALDSSGITQIRNIPALNLRGNGVLIGILDTGIDYTNPIFLNSDRTTRIAQLWDQTIVQDTYVPNTYYGTVFTREQINLALQSENPLDIVPSTDEIGHGTMIAGIAAGNEVPEQNFSGVVPDAELVVVKLKPAKQNLKEFWRIPNDAICYQENDIVYALEYLELTANKLGRPMSICLALGSSLGSHDSKSLLNTDLTLRAETLNFSLAIAGGNEGNARRHYFGTIDPSIGNDKVELNIGENEGNFSMELWGASPGLFAMDIQTPTGESARGISSTTNKNFEITFLFSQTKILMDSQFVEAQSGDQLILLRFTDPTPGTWVFNVYGKGDLNLSFHIWLPMEGFISNRTYFLRSDPYTTLLSFGNASDPITITAYNPDDDSLYSNASRGYTRRNDIKPDIAAPGVNITSPTLDQGFSSVSGSSPAAAHAAGVAAMILEWGIVEGRLPFMSTADIKMLMIRGAKREIGQTYPNRDWGYGILDAYNIFNRLRSI